MEKCTSCDLAAGVGLVLGICEKLKPEGIDCDDLYQKVVKGELTPDEVVEIVRSKVKDKKAVEDINLIHSLMHKDDVHD